MQSKTIEALLKAANSSPETDTSVNSAKRFFEDVGEAERFFREARSRLFRIDQWKQLSSATDYDLYRDDGTQANDEPISIGLFIRISLYGGGKYDWVRVTSITDEPEEVVITVKPSFDPTAPSDEQNSISHFFGPEATNNFCLQHHESTVSLYVIGLNEHTNTKFADGLIETARNMAVANVGYYSGLQKAIWKEFCSNFLRSPEERKS